MGMFDSVNFTCPECGGIVEFQSKKGECLLTDFSPEKVPLDIANDIEHEMQECRGCGKVYRAKLAPFNPLFVKMVIE